MKKYIILFSYLLLTTYSTSHLFAAILQRAPREGMTFLATYGALTSDDVLTARLGSTLESFGGRRSAGVVPNHGLEFTMNSHPIKKGGANIHPKDGQNISVSVIELPESVIAEKIDPTEGLKEHWYKRATGLPVNLEDGTTVRANYYQAYTRGEPSASRLEYLEAMLKGAETNFPGSGQIAQIQKQIDFSRANPLPEVSGGLDPRTLNTATTAKAAGDVHK